MPSCFEEELFHLICAHFLASATASSWSHHECHECWLQLKDKAREMLDVKNKAVAAAREFKAAAEEKASELAQASLALAEARGAAAAAQKVGF